MHLQQHVAIVAAAVVLACVPLRVSVASTPAASGTRYYLPGVQPDVLVRPRAPVPPPDGGPPLLGPEGQPVTPEPVPPTPEPGAKVVPPGTPGAVPYDQGSLQGVGFGLALGVAHFADKDIKSVSADANKIVRVSDGDKTNLGFWMELHYFFSEELGFKSEGFDSKNHPAYKYGLGPFVGVQVVGDDKILQTLGVGLMFGMRRDVESSNSLNFGLGYAVSRIHVLSDGLTANQALPSGIAEASTKTKTTGGVFFITSFSF